MFRSDKQFMTNPATAPARIYVGNIAESVLHDSLDELFRQHGRILGLVLQRGFGFIQFENAEQAQAAIRAQNGVQFHNRKLVVKPANVDKSKAVAGGAGPPPQQQQGPSSQPPPRNQQNQQQQQFQPPGGPNNNKGNTWKPPQQQQQQGPPKPPGSDSGDSGRDRDSQKPMRNNFNESGGGDSSMNNRSGSMDESGMGHQGGGGGDVGPRGGGGDGGPRGGGGDGGPRGGGGDGGPRGGDRGGSGDRGRNNRSRRGKRGGPGKNFRGDDFDDYDNYDYGSNNNSNKGGPQGNNRMNQGPPHMGGGPGMGGRPGMGPGGGGPGGFGPGAGGMGSRGGPGDMVIGGHGGMGPQGPGGMGHGPHGGFHGPGGDVIMPPIGGNTGGDRASERNDCEIIVVSKQLTNYAEFLESRLKGLGLIVDLLFPNEDVPIGRVLANISSRGCLFAILVMPANEENRSLTLNILHGIPQEHRNMPMEDAFLLITRNFTAYMRGEPVESSECSKKLTDRHPEHIQVIFNMLAENRQLASGQYDRVLRYLQERRELQQQFELAEGIESDLVEPEVKTKRAELQSRIMSILNTKTQEEVSSTAKAATAPIKDPTIPASVVPPTTVAASAVIAAAAVTTPATKSSIPSTVSGVQGVLGTTASSKKAPILNDPSVQKALDSILMGDMFKSIKNSL